ncbi:EamA-like transporter family protein [Tibeticola sediminis]|uniref:EamA-like transporter family protein n=1 Tax=Tibeticola sediminis TaxID=1917811 RepID=A0A3N4UNV1_9BURK|nr:EamA family transporter [Tibeticola sediminis]RPE72336.1 EamA-like transporter family protein [Tibeticola sediminis]
MDERGRAAAALLFNALVWGLSWLPFRTLYERGWHPLAATALVYGAIVAGLLLWRPGLLAGLVRNRSLGWLALASGLTNACFNWAVTVGDVVRVVLLFYLMPAWSILFAWWLLGERPDRWALARLLLALAGVVLVLKPPEAPWPLPSSLSDVLAILGGASFALTNVLLLRWRSQPDDLRAFSMFFGGTLVAALSAAALGSAVVPASFEGVRAAAPWALALGVGLLAGNAALQYGAARLPAQATALIMLSEVVFASASALWLHAAAWEARTLLGGALVLAAAVAAWVRPRAV